MESSWQRNIGEMGKAERRQADRSRPRKRTSLRELLIAAVTTDNQAELIDGAWRTRCLHCRSALYISHEGVTTNGATLEHIIPRSWFEKRASADLIGHLTGPNDVRNLALACPRCNQGKGLAHDKAGPNDPRAREVVMALFDKRQARFVAASNPE
jgi:5-methylcytosine-specific restriction endonuclease McrA